jgi:putative Mg2+ transporter-C (MgtC) family protein
MLGLDAQLVVQILTALVLGGAIGFEREVAGREAGLRTMILVCLGSTLVMVVSERLSVERTSVLFRVDPTRIGAGIVTGIGFVGGGVILKQRNLIRGVTTAAAIWFVAGLGIAIGVRLYAVAAFATLVALFVLVLLQIPERFLKSYIYRVVTIAVRSSASEAVLSSVRGLLEREARIMDLEAAQDVEHGITTLSVHIRTHQRFQGPEIIAKIGALEGVQRVAWS